MAAEVVLFAEHHREAAASGVPGDTGAVDTASNHQQVVLATLVQGQILPVCAKSLIFLAVYRVGECSSAGAPCNPKIRVGKFFDFKEK
jgi:hypothetical protein